MFVLLNKHAGWAHKKAAADQSKLLMIVQDARFSLWLKTFNFGWMTFQWCNVYGANRTVCSGTL